MDRKIILDTETTGLDIKDKHRIIEIGCVEMIDRNLTGNNRHIYLNPNRRIDNSAMKIHGIHNRCFINRETCAVIKLLIISLPCRRPPCETPQEDTQRVCKEA